MCLPDYAKEGDSYLVARTITVTEKEPETQAAGDSGTEEVRGQRGSRSFARTAGRGRGSCSEEESQESDLTEVPEEGEISDETVNPSENPDSNTTTESEETISEDDGFASDILPEEEFDSELERAEEEVTVDPETGFTLGEVLEQAEEQEIDFLSLEEGETVSFIATYASTRTDVDVTRGTCYYYSDYGLGSYLTYKYTVKFDNVSATAYCIQPSKNSPGDGVYKITKLGDGKKLAKVCYYGTKASGVNGFFKQEHPDFSAGKQFVITHLAVSYASGGDDAFSGQTLPDRLLPWNFMNTAWHSRISQMLPWSFPMTT